MGGYGQQIKRPFDKRTKRTHPQKTKQPRGGTGIIMGRKEGYAAPVAVASFSMDPVLINWLNGYAQEHRTTKSSIVRRAILDFKEKVTPKGWDCPKCGAQGNLLDFDTCWKCEEAKP